MVYLNQFYLLTFYPALLTIGQTDLLPLAHRTIGDDDLRALVEDEKIGAVSSRRALHRDGGRHDDSPLAMDERLLLLVGEHIGEDENHQQRDATKEAYLAQPYVFERASWRLKRISRSPGESSSARS